LSIHKGLVGFFTEERPWRYFFGLLVKITKKGLTRAGKHPKLSSVCAGRNFPFVVLNNNIKGIYLTL
jgi:hypothetical protein